jgi:hypothetical protein
MADLLGGYVEYHIAILLRSAARPALKEIGHGGADLSPLPTQRFLEHLGKSGSGRSGFAWYWSFRERTNTNSLH